MRNRYKLLLAAILAAPTATASAQVTQSWVQRFDGPAQDDDFVSEIDVDSAGNAYVVGGVREFIPPNSLMPRFLTIKYDPAGNEVWTRTYKAGPPNLDASFAFSVAVDGNDDVLVVGSVQNSANWGVVKYDQAGNQLWSRTYAVGSVSLTNPEQVVVDDQDNVYLTGYANGMATTVKYDSSGNFQWDLKFNGSGNGATSEAMVVDALGNAYVAGSITVAGFAVELGVHKIGPAGNVLWTHTSGYPGFSSDRASDVALDGAGNVVVAGVYGANTSLGPDMVALKFDPTGTLIWQRFWDGPAARSDYTARLVLDGQDAVILAGYTQTAASDYDAAAVKFDANGVLQWANVYAGGAANSDYAWDVGVDSNDNVIVAGQVYPLTGDDHYFTVCYDSGGSQKWEMLYGGPLNGSSVGRALAVDGDAVYVTGESSNFNLDVDIATIRYENPAATIYCTSQPNSQGCTPSVGFSGTPSASAGSGFTFTVDDLINNKNGIVFYGKTGPQGTPFLGGTMCVAPPVVRTGLQSSGGNPPPDDCSGAIAFDFNAWIASGQDPALVAGQQVWVQYWSRDPNAVGTTSNLSDALTFTVGN